jgi:2'-5' RNA ligase
LKTRRLFYALWPDEDVRRALAAWQRRNLPKSVRATHVQDLHITLHFLGQVEESQTAALLALGERLPLPAFGMTLDRLGHWARPAVLWAGPSETPQPLQAFHERLVEELEGLGFEREGRAFRPHLTLARKMRRAPEDLGFEPLKWAVAEWALLESRPGERPLYHPIARWAAKG